MLKLYWTSATTGSAVCSLVIPQTGLITSIAWAVSAKAGAGVDGLCMYELSTASVTSITTNDTPGNSLDNVMLSAPISGGASHVAKSSAGFAIPVQAGDRLYIHCYASGTAVATLAGECNVAVS